MTEVEELELQKEVNKDLIRQRDLLNKLEQNPEFKELILDNFCTKECARYVHVSTDSRVTPEYRENALNTAKAAGYFLNYLDMIRLKGNNAEASMERIDDELDAIRGE